MMVAPHYELAPAHPERLPTERVRRKGFTNNFQGQFSHDCYVFVSYSNLTFGPVPNNSERIRMRAFIMEIISHSYSLFCCALQIGAFAGH